MPEPATLYVVATPLGNLGDLSHRAEATLRTVPVVAAEDTRRIRGLLSHLDAHPKVLSFHAHSPERRRESLLEILADGRDVALVTDAGTPGVSDPGESLVEAVRAAGVRVVPIPGPSAVTTALSASGLSADRYLFLGFIPRKGKDRERLLQQAASCPWTVVLYEAPTRLAELLADLSRVAGADRQAVVARELTKLFEEFRAGTVAELAAYYEATEPRGEITVVVAGRPEGASPAEDLPDVGEHAARLLATGLSRKDAVHHLVQALGISRNEAYRIVTSLP
ncbi:MAG: 16S rRNA (cytidine(1402)-2'-O)-methyltransferase [Gemmatimonadetes bacterium]|nr:16S rRNA (cytidine(1402)-2'-O)-methyltransferase [Gemmatimonadota bacterium]MBK6778695.1 16S rRNA (cytidine(1402)-2'-O)-methyltransferase [Gemmatimonadota bacterium]